MTTQAIAPSRLALVAERQRRHLRQDLAVVITALAVGVATLTTACAALVTGGMS